MGPCTGGVMKKKETVAGIYIAGDEVPLGSSSRNTKSGQDFQITLLSAALVQPQ